MISCHSSRGGPLIVLSSINSSKSTPASVTSPFRTSQRAILTCLQILTLIILLHSGTAFASFLLLGFLEIGAEMQVSFLLYLTPVQCINHPHHNHHSENPFNYDANDLGKHPHPSFDTACADLTTTDLDHFCLTIQRELHEITAHTAPQPGDYVFSAWNQPFAPADRRTAEELMRHDVYTPPGAKASPDSANEFGTVSSVRSTLLRSWRDVDSKTRDESRWQ